MTTFTSRFLERRDLVSFLSGQLLGFALDEFFDGAYLGAFDSDGSPAGFIYAGHPRSDGEILIGVPHPAHGRTSSPELDAFLVAEATRNASSKSSLVVAAVYSDQTKEERIALQEIYRNLGFRYCRDSTILTRTLEDLPDPPELFSESIDEAGDDLFVSVASACARGTGWGEVDFAGYIPAWRRSAKFDPELFRLARMGGQPAGVLLARVDKLDPREGAFYFLGIMPHVRGRGIGRALLLKGLHLLRERGVVRTRQTIPSGEGPSLRLLENAGYQMVEWARFFQLEAPGASHGSPIPGR
ncbi:GNAT family N-acetyltransferase [Candidatus Fermentibacteria bacterium]|nr:GNAT family N-acetyltransferase [Candidatus Fermentibacteria bacterium]